MGICSDRVVIVTGAARGIGREHALALAAEGAAVVVNDLGVAADGSGSSLEPAQAVVAEIEAAGGRALASADDIADFDAAGRLVDAAVQGFGRLDAVVNNAGFVRDRMFVSCSPDEWDAVIRVHLRGHFCVTNKACAYWRARSKAGNTVDARIINTSSGAGLLGSVGQSAYAAAKAGIAALTLVQAVELGRYGITANAIAPAARTRMTESVFGDMMKAPDDGFDAFDPANIPPLVVWLCSAEAAAVTGRVFELQGGEIKLNNGWHPVATIDKGARWRPSDLGAPIAKMLAESPAPLRPYGAG